MDTVSCHYSSFRLQPHKSSALAASERILVAMDANDHDTRPDRPFTDFGQFGSGKLDLRVFLQDEYWVDKDGTGHLITSMSDDYRSNVIRMLLIEAEVLHMEILILITGMIAGAIVNRDADGMESLKRNEIPLLQTESSYDFIENTPLMKRLRELSPNGPALGDLLLHEIQRTDDE